MWLFIPTLIIDQSEHSVQSYQPIRTQIADKLTNQITGHMWLFIHRLIRHNITTAQLCGLLSFSQLSTFRSRDESVINTDYADNFWYHHVKLITFDWKLNFISVFQSQLILFAACFEGIEPADNHCAIIVDAINLEADSLHLKQSQTWVITI